MQAGAAVLRNSCSAGGTDSGTLRRGGTARAWLSGIDLRRSRAVGGQVVRRFDDRWDGGPSGSGKWHLDTLREQGFTEARQIWRSPSDALIAALR